MGGFVPNIARGGKAETETVTPSPFNASGEKSSFPQNTS